MLRPLQAATSLAVLAVLASVVPSMPALAAEVCGDVNESSSVTSTDSLLVLKKAVGQPVSLTCPAIDDLAACLSGTCGNDLAENDEPCDGADLHGKTCATEAPDTPYGTLSCDKECGGFDTSGCSGRFDSTGNTILDHALGLEWEKKVGTSGEDQSCGFGGDCSDIHGVNNLYRWSASGTAPDGEGFTGLLATLNGAYDGVCYEGHCDWRLPTREELKVIHDNPSAFSPDGARLYWSVTTYESNFGMAWPVYTGNASAGATDKPTSHRMRAVRDMY